MASWADLRTEASPLATRAKALFDAHTHKTIATIRRDGTPRISGIETSFVGDDLWFGSMWHGTKALDLLRNPAFALHSGSVDPPAWAGDAKIAGRAVAVTDPDEVSRVVPDHEPGGIHLFRADITELVVVSLNAEKTKLVIETWHEGRGVARHER